MRFHAGTSRAVALILASSLAVLTNASAADKKNQAKAPANLTVDSGSFGVFVEGKRVTTETFTIQQQASNSVIKAQVKVISSEPTTQKSSLEITSSGEMIRYEWSQSSGGSLSVLPKNDFLIETISTPSSSKPAEQPFLMPSTSAILDNNFFVHREVLVWRFLAAVCKPEGGSFKCQQDPGDFGVLVPQDRTSIHVRLELVGKEKINVRGTDRSLMRLNLKGESFDWALWVDEQDHFKLIKVAIPADNTEVVRD
ncbi:MAG TPA: hypothetical protein VE377_17800 [Candidatus Dormibacteraeota bacterium]|nr:hypothetical protein [Candidatus Dormibacteraeota bacterium]